MREFKFRAWDKSSERMIYPDGNTISDIVKASNECSDEFWFEEDEDIWMQSTGLKDKNGKEIFEGDILKYDDIICVVSYNERKASLCLDSKNWFFTHYFGEGVKSVECEVIGNIYENKELLD